MFEGDSADTCGKIFAGGDGGLCMRRPRQFGLVDPVSSTFGYLYFFFFFTSKGNEP
jgi:hypothetical protein